MSYFLWESADAVHASMSVRTIFVKIMSEMEKIVVAEP